MESLSSFSCSTFDEKQAREFSIQSEQDGLFFGSEFLRCFFKTSDAENSTITTYLKDGDCVFKEQICVKVNLTDSAFNKKELLSVISYFSGAYTLLSCFTEKNFDFSIYASTTPEFSFSEWEEKIILKAGALIQKCPEDICFHPKDVVQALKRKEEQIILSNLKMSNEEIKDILKDLPSSIKACLQGSFFPSDLEELSVFNLNSVWPICLQGSFPCLKMKLIEDKQPV